MIEPALLGDFVPDATLPHAPIPDPRPMAAEHLHSYLNLGDSVRTNSYDDLPSFVGRIVSLALSLPDSAPIHPHTDIGSNTGFLLIQIYATPLTEGHVNWPAPAMPDFQVQWQSRSARARRACGNVPPAAETNFVVWIEVEQVQTFAFFIHTEDCIKHTWGCVDGRRNTYAIDKYLDGNFQLQPLNFDLYNTFGTSLIGGKYFVSATESCLETILIESSKMRMQLNTMGSHGGSRSQGCFMSRASWQIWCHLTAGCSMGSHSVNRAVKTVGPDLSFGIVAVERRIGSIAATDSAQFRILKDVGGINMLSGRKGTFPPLVSAHDMTNNPRKIQVGDVIHLIDMDLGGVDDGVDSVEAQAWLDPEANLQHTHFCSSRNYVKFRYDPATRRQTLSVKAIAVVANTGLRRVHAGFDDYMDRMTIASRPFRSSLMSRIRSGSRVYRGDNTVWRISDINDSTRRFTISNQEDQREYIEVSYNDDFIVA